MAYFLKKTKTKNDIYLQIYESFYNPQLAKKQRFEINRQIEKARGLKASQAKRSEYGDCAKYVIFTTTDKKGNETDGKVKVSEWGVRTKSWTPQGLRKELN